MTYSSRLQSRRMTPTLVLFAALILCASSLSQSEIDALLDLSSNWPALRALTYKPWAAENVTMACTRWRGITCGPNNNVTAIVLYNISLQVIPNSIARLPALVNLQLRQASITGTIPASLFGLSNIGWLALDKNNLQGPIPDLFDSVPNLNVFTVSMSNLSGSIPGSMSLLTNLQILDLSYNSITGTIPEFIGAYAQISNLYLQHNQFYGGIPAGVLWNSIYLKNVDLSVNSLTGQLPQSSASSRIRSSINLSHNLLTGSLASLSSMTISSLDLSYNQLSDTIPDFKTGLTQLFLNNNKLSGTIPDTLVTSTTLQAFNASNNKLNLCPSGFSVIVFSSSFFTKGGSECNLSNQAELSCGCQYQNCVTDGACPSKDIGIFIGVALGVAALLAVAIGFGIWCFKRRSANRSMLGEYEPLR